MKWKEKKENGVKKDARQEAQVSTRRNASVGSADSAVAAGRANRRPALLGAASAWESPSSVGGMR